MNEGGTMTRSTWRLAGLLLVLVAALGAQAEPPSSKLPGRQPDSKEPWGAFLGRVAHEVIGLEYRVQHPSSVVFLNTASLSTIVEGALFLEFENGGALWKLSWRTPEPGVTLYRWSYRRKKPGASWKERAAQKEEELPREEVELRGDLAEQAIRAAYGGGERPKGFQGQVYLPVDCR